MSKIIPFKFCNGDLPLVGVGKYKSLVNAVQVALDLVIGGADYGLEAETAHQGNAAGHFFRIHFGKCLI